MNSLSNTALALALTLGLGTASATQTATTPAASAKPAATPPAAAQPAAAPPLKGEVVESIDAPPYTYLRLKTAAGETWAAVLKAPVKKGQQVAVENPMVMTNFQSKSLNRTFDKIVFGTLAGTAPSGSNVTPAQMTPAGAAAAPAATGAAAASPHAGAMPMGAGQASPHAGMQGMPGMPAAAAPAASVPVEKVAKATGADARTVAEAYAQRAQLTGKDVVVRAKVVKFLPGIMGKNWVHLQDGSGSAADGTNDLTANTQQTVKVGDVVVAKGVLRTDVDVGMGSKYKVLLEDAKFQK